MTYVYVGTAVKSAASQGDVDLLQSLLDNIEDNDIVNDALYISTKQRHIECVKYLLTKGADPTCWEASDDETSLSIACAGGNVEILTMFLAKGCDVNAKCNGDMHTALHSSALYGHAQCVQLLLDNKADPNIKDCFAHTALMRACQNDHFDTAAILLANGADPMIKNIRRENAFIISLYQNKANCVRELLIARPQFSTERTSEGLLPLTYALRSGNEVLTQAFVEAGCDLNATEGLLLTPLQIAIETGHIPTIRTLVQGGCDINASLGIPSGSTPLMLATCKGNVDIVNVLVEGGCDLDQLDRHARTALYLAVKHGYLQCVHRLLLGGSDPDVIPDDGQISPNVVHCAIIYNRREELLALIQAGCDLLVTVMYEDLVNVPITPLELALFLSSTSWAVTLLLSANPSLIRNIQPYKGSDMEIKYLLEEALKQVLKPTPLKTLCRQYIRSKLDNKDLFRKICKLPLPVPLLDFLLYKDLEFLI